MGVDFLRRSARSFHKGLDRRRVELGTPTLFTQQPEAAPRTYAATVRSGETLAAGEKIGVRLDGECVVALRGLDLIATINRPPAELLAALSASHGEACGTVHQMHDVARVAEITVC